MTQTINFPQPIGSADKVTMHQARRAFQSGAQIIVTEQPKGETIPVWTTTTVNTNQATTWTELHDQVKMWRNRYPRQTFYVVRSDAS